MAWRLSTRSMRLARRRLRTAQALCRRPTGRRAAGSTRDVEVRAAEGGPGAVSPDTGVEAAIADEPVTSEA
jgi:hypothetical protein